MIDEKKWLLRIVTGLLALIVVGIFTLAVMFAPRAEQKRYSFSTGKHWYCLFDPATGDLYMRKWIEGKGSSPTWEPVCSFPDTATAEKIRLRIEADAAAERAAKARQRKEATKARDATN